MADLTASNANVFYELGVAHAKGKPTVLITQSIEEVPFDLRSYNVLDYTTDYRKIEEFKAHLKRIAQDALSGDIQFGNPVSDFWEPSGQVTAPPTSPPAPPTEPEQPSEKEEKGLWDYAADAETSMLTATTRLQTMADAMERLGKQVTAKGAKLKDLTQETRPGTAARVRQTITLVANDMIEFTKDVRNALPDFRDSWVGVEANVVPMLSSVNVHVQEDIEAVRGYREKLQELLPKIERTAESLGGFRKTVAGLRGASRDLNFASDQTSRSISDVIEELKRAQAICVRIISKIDDLLGQVS